MNSTLVAKSAGGVVILVGTGVGGTYIATKDDVKSQVKTALLDDKDKDIYWKEAQERLKSEENSSELISPFKELKANLSKVEKDDEKGARIKAVCLDVYSWIYKSAFSSKEEKLIEQVKKYCSPVNKKISERLQGLLVPVAESETTAWTKAQNKLKTAIKKDNSGLKQTFKDAYEKINKTGSDADTTKQGNGTFLKEVCQAAYEQTTNARDEKKELTENVKTYCSIKIKEVWETGKTFDTPTNDTTEAQDLKTKRKALNDQSADADDELKANFKKWKVENYEGWKEFRTWCQGLYEKPYLGTTDKNWKLAETNCKKS